MSAVIVIELLMLTMIIHVNHYSGFTKQQRFWFVLTFISVMICTLSEYLVHGVTYDNRFKIPLTIITVVQFSTAPLLGVFFSGALGLHKQARIMTFAFLSNALIETVLAPFGLIFTFTETQYERGDLFWIYEVFYFLALLYLAVSMILVGKKFKHRDGITILMVMVILIAGILPMTFFKTHITYIAIGIAACVCYIYYNDLVQQDIKSELVLNQQKMSEMQIHTISGLANIIENRDMETGEHITRTTYYVKKLAEHARDEGVYADILTDHYIELLETLAPMHDVGKIVVSDKILKKPGKLTPAEYEEMKKHTSEGGRVVREILKDISDEEYLRFASDIATYHHERWDGSGYPKGLKGEEIPLCARIMAIADVFDALISERCYKDAMPIEDALKIMKEEGDSHFDPKLLEVFLKHIQEDIKKE